MKVLVKRLKRSEREAEELKTRLDYASQQQKQAEAWSSKLQAKLEAMEIELQMERAFSRKMKAKCRELEGEFSRLQLHNHYTKQELKRAESPLPMELMIEILSRLPAKSLLRCRSVCKYWLSLISSTRFKFMHLHNSNQLNPRSIFRYISPDDIDNEVYRVHFDDEDLSLDHDTLIHFEDFRLDAFCYRIIGSCHGVICLMDSVGSIILWNPSIRRAVFRDATDFLPAQVIYGFYGFGYDPMSDDYKVIGFVYDHSHGLHTRPMVEVYTVNTGITRTIMFPHDLPCFEIVREWSQVFLNGSLHWIAYHIRDDDTVTSYAIMTFDVSSEVFGEIQLPECLRGKFQMNLVVAIVEESLAVIHIEHTDSWKYKIWAMEDYKNPDSWTMVCYIHTSSSDLRKALRRIHKEKIEFREGGYRDLMINDHDLTYFVNPDNDCVDVGSWVYVDKFQESLALLDVGCSAGEELSR